MAEPECSYAGEIAAYALGALDPAAEAEVTAHLEGCARCRTQLRWLQPALETLPESVEQVTPPPELRERLMAAVREEVARPARASGEPARRSWREWRLRIGGFAFGPATALAAVLIVTAAVVGYTARDQGEDARTVAVSSTLQGSSAELELTGEEATLRAHGVPQLPMGSVYQVWVRNGATVRPSSVFRPSDDGSAAAAVPEALHGADQVMVTRERRRGATAPSEAPVYAGTIAN
ncbi:MAG: anti-sigma factor [Solirubrobacterales bacterium]